MNFVNFGNAQHEIIFIISKTMFVYMLRKSYFCTERKNHSQNSTPY